MLLSPLILSQALLVSFLNYNARQLYFYAQCFSLKLFYKSLWKLSSRFFCCNYENWIIVLHLLPVTILQLSFTWSRGGLSLFWGHRRNYLSLKVHVTYWCYFKISSHYLIDFYRFSSAAGRLCCGQMPCRQQKHMTHARLRNRSINSEMFHIPSDMKA